MSRLLLVVQAAMEDVEGALSMGQYDVAAIEARTLMLHCLSIRSLQYGGELDGLFICYQASFDPLEGLDAATVAEGLALAQTGLDVANAETALVWVTSLRAYFEAIEDLIGIDGHLPLLRSSEGLYSALRTARPWLNYMEEMGLPSLLPSHWVKSEQ